MFLHKLVTIRYLLDGKQVPKGTPGAVRKKVKSKLWYAVEKLRGGKKKYHPMARDKAVAQSMLSDLLKARERGQAGLVNPHAEHLAAGIGKHVEEYLDDMRHKGRNPRHILNVKGQLEAIIEAEGVATLADLTAEKVDHFLQGLDRSARTKNAYRQSALGFCIWCERKRRLPDNPLRFVSRASGEVKRRRRALPLEQLPRLFDAARRRPLEEALTVWKGKRKGEKYAKVRPEVQTERRRLGQERYLIYKIAVMTGLREDEIRRLRVIDFDFSMDSPFVRIPPKHDAKNKTEARLPLRPDFAAELRAWAAEARKAGADLMFTVPMAMVKILRRDLAMAGIPYRDDEGKVFDFHSLRKCCQTYLRLAKVDPRLRQLFLRHKNIRLTMETYDDAVMADLRTEALDKLPSLE